MYPNNVPNTTQSTSWSKTNLLRRAFTSSESLETVSGHSREVLQVQDQIIYMSPNKGLGPEEPC